MGENYRRRRRAWLVGVAASGGVVLGVVTAAGAAQAPATSESQARGAEALRLDQQVITLSQREEVLQGELASARRALAASEVSPASTRATVPAPATTAPPVVTTTLPVPVPAPAAVTPQPAPGSSGPTTTAPPADDHDPTPTSTTSTTTLPPASTTTTQAPTTTTTRPRHGGGGGSGD